MAWSPGRRQIGQHRGCKVVFPVKWPRRRRLAVASGQCGRQSRGEWGRARSPSRGGSAAGSLTRSRGGAPRTPPQPGRRRMVEKMAGCYCYGYVYGHVCYGSVTYVLPPSLLQVRVLVFCSLCLFLNFCKVGELIWDLLLVYTVFACTFQLKHTICF